MILDTNGLSALADGDLLIDALLGRNEIWIPSIVLGEYLEGLRRSRFRLEYEAWLREHFDNDEAVLSVTRHTAAHFADVRTELRDIGKPIPQNDLWIAALAREHNMPIVSRDAHFDVVPGIKRLGW